MSELSEKEQLLEAAKQGLTVNDWERLFNLVAGNRNTALIDYRDLPYSSTMTYEQYRKCLDDHSDGATVILDETSMANSEQVYKEIEQALAK